MKKLLTTLKERQPMEPGELFGGLLRHLQKREVHKEYNLTTVGKLTESELHEYKIISANGDALNKEFTKLIQRRQEIEARNTLFWASLRRNHNCPEEEFLHLEDTKDGVLLQSGVKKNESLTPDNPFSGLFGN